MRKIAQFRFYGSKKSEMNQPYGIKKASFITGAVFAECKHIYQLGIQTLPGTEFYVNGSPNPIIVGTTGVYELDLNNNTEITSLSFSKLSLDNIENSPSGYLIVDVIYEDRKE